jgi:hypothetical protein
MKSRRNLGNWPTLMLSLSATILAIGYGRADDRGSKPDAAADHPLAFQDDFERDEPKGWDFTDRNAWRLARLDDSHGRVLEQFRESKYQPAVRSPLNIALVQGHDLGDFVLDLQVRSTGRDYGHRDLCLFFGHQDPSHFYYVHLGKQADPAANSIFLVDGKPRVSIAEKRTSGTPWTDGWHHVRIVRNVGDGLIQVYFDDMKVPAMTAHDRTFTHGRLGVGSFDDTGMFDQVRIWGKSAEGPSTASGDPAR